MNRAKMSIYHIFAEKMKKLTFFRCRKVFHSEKSAKMRNELIIARRKSICATEFRASGKRQIQTASNVIILNHFACTYLLVKHEDVI